MAKRNRDQLKPLRAFDFGLISERIQGLFINVDRETEKKLNSAAACGERESDRCLSLLRIMIRFAWNSYCAVLHLAGDLPENYLRKPEFVLVVPSINRQLLDLLFSLAYMRDSFEERSLLYQQAGWRELFEEYQHLKTHASSEADWSPHLRNLSQILSRMVERFNIPEAAVNNPLAIPYWPTPNQLKDQRTNSRPFLRHLKKWLYRDTSAQAHLSFGGLLPMQGFLVPDSEIADRDKRMRDHALQIYRSQQVSRTVILFLAIATEVDAQVQLNNQEAINFLWGVLAEYFAEAKELWLIRYRDRLALLKDD